MNEKRVGVRDYPPIRINFLNPSSFFGADSFFVCGGADYFCEARLDLRFLGFPGSGFIRGSGVFVFPGFGVLGL